MFIKNENLKKTKFLNKYESSKFQNFGQIQNLFEKKQNFQIFKKKMKSNMDSFHRVRKLIF